MIEHIHYHSVQRHWRVIKSCRLPVVHEFGVEYAAVIEERVCVGHHQLCWRSSAKNASGSDALSFSTYTWAILQCCNQGTRCRVRDQDRGSRVRDRGRDRGSIPQDQGRGTRQLAYIINSAVFP